MENYKNRYININKSQGMGPLHKRNLSSYDNTNNISKQLNYSNLITLYEIISSF